MILLNGSYKEGGGQILRTALALSMLTQKSFKIKKIRAKRPVSGLKSSHLAGIKALLELSESKAIGADIGSLYIEFHPKPITKFNTYVDVGTAGPITLVLQTLMIPLMFAKKKSRLKIRGGTDAAWSPTYDYFDKVILPQYNRYSNVKIKLLKRGYYPKGGGEVEISINPNISYDNIKEKDNPLILETAENLLSIKGIVNASKSLIDNNVCERIAHSAKFYLNRYKVPVILNTQYADSLSAGASITLWAFLSDKEEINFDNPIIIGSDALGKKGKKAEIVGEEAAKKLGYYIDSKIIVDAHLADNLMPLLALFKGKIKVSKITNHILSNIYVCEEFLDKKFEIDKENKIIEVK